MAKKRRTKAQKARTAVHRTSQLQRLISKPIPSSKPAEFKPEAQEAPAPVFYRRADLKRSLLLIALLVLIQLLSWLGFRMSHFDERLYEWIKL